ncbi:MAG: 16S rRNA (uracil(1498)-N(3))-methyltransferase [Candidatus Omnitrophota bacterium]
MMFRFYVPPENIKDNTIEISGTEAHHLTHVLRKKIGEKIIIIDGQGKEYLTKIRKIHGQKITADVLSAKSILPEKLNLTLACALAKGNRIDYVVEKCTELGVKKIIPLLTKNTVVKIERDGKKKLNRWQKIAISAAKQCGCTMLPEITPVMNFKEVLPQISQYELSLIAAPGYNGITFKQITQKFKQLNDVLVFIGPEGDFSKAEIKEAVVAGCEVFGLGKNILRTDTAAIVASALFCLYYGENR